MLYIYQLFFEIMMENFAFSQFLGQIYQLNPELKVHDQLVRQFLREELKWRKSFVVHAAVTDKAHAYVQKRINLTNIDWNILQDDSMLFVKVDVESMNTWDEEDDLDINEIINRQEKKLEEVEDDIDEKSDWSFWVFVLWFIIGGVVVAAIFLLMSGWVMYEYLPEMF